MCISKHECLTSTTRVQDTSYTLLRLPGSLPATQGQRATEPSSGFFPWLITNHEYEAQA